MWSFVVFSAHFANAGSSFNSEDRELYLTRAVSWLGDQPTTAEEILAGPSVKRPFAMDETVYCKFFPRANGGSNPKFRCHLTNEQGVYVDTDGELQPEAVSVNLETDELLDSAGRVLGKADELKVKYYRGKSAAEKKDTDPYTEVAATRVFWALGFPADRMYGTKEVVCFNCPANPIDNTGPVAPQRIYPEAAIERKLPGKKIEPVKNYGFDFGEAWNQKTWTPEQRHQFEAMMLLSTLIRQVRNAAGQNRFSCASGSIDADGMCTKSVLISQDLGASFGGTAKILRFIRYNSKGSLRHWAREKIWGDPRTCVLGMKFRGIPVPQISEGGRKFLSNLLADFDEVKIGAAFLAGRFHKLDSRVGEHAAKIVGKIADPAARAQAIQNEAIKIWVNVFKKKVGEINAVTCPMP